VYEFSVLVWIEGVIELHRRMTWHDSKYHSCVGQMFDFRMGGE
jgi:hypothetical protein